MVKNDKIKNKKKDNNKEKNDDISFEEQEYVEVSLFKNPIETLKTLLIILFEQFQNLLYFIQKYFYIGILILAYIYYMNFVDGSHSTYNKSINEFLYFACYWLVLGIASSIGLGTGLHTFVLYLGPHIAKVTLAANECNYFPVYNPNRWSFKDFLPCTTPADPNHPNNSFWTILFQVQLEAFLWGLGTAIGELPPYYMAKAASEAGIKDEEFEEIKHLEDAPPEGIVKRVKVFIYQHLKKHGFITVLISASVPNPLFDLAGITCGHFRIPFWTFFGATAIGKAIIKVHLQDYIPALQGILTTTLEKQKKLLWNKNTGEQLDEGKPLIASIWEVLISFMIVYFLISIINSVVNERRVFYKLITFKYLEKRTKRKRVRFRICK